MKFQDNSHEMCLVNKINSKHSSRNKKHVTVIWYTLIVITIGCSLFIHVIMKDT